MYALSRQHRAPSTTWWMLALTATAAALVAVLAWRIEWDVVGWSVGAGLVAATVAAAVDVTTGRLPDPLVLATLAPATLAVVVAAADGEGAATLAAVALGAGVFAGPLFVAHLVSPAAIGFGDVKLALALGGLLGLVDARLGLFALCVGSGVTATIGLLRRRASLPFGPGLVLGATVAALLAGPVGGAVLTWR